MRVALLAAVVFISACAADGFSWRRRPAWISAAIGSSTWRTATIPMHLLQMANAQDRRRHRRRQLPAGGAAAAAGQVRHDPAVDAARRRPPSACWLRRLRLPGKQLEIKQVRRRRHVHFFGIRRVCASRGDAKRTPSTSRRRFRSRRPLPAARDDRRRRACGWLEKTLIVAAGEPDEDRPPFEEHYSMSEDGQRLIEDSDFPGRPFQRIHDVAGVGPHRPANKKAGHLPGF